MPNLKTESNNVSDVVKYEADQNFSREAAMLANGAGDLKIGTVLGKITTGTIGAAVAGANTGDGVPTAATGGSKTEVGTYTLTCITAAANLATFEIKTPGGLRLAGDLTTDVAYVSDHLNMTIPDGAADFVVGDSFAYSVSGSGEYVKADPTLVNGAQKAAAVLIKDDDATAAAVKTVILKRDAIVNRNNLVWDASINTPAERQTAVDELEAVGIVARTGS